MFDKLYKIYRLLDKDFNLVNKVFKQDTLLIVASILYTLYEIRKAIEDLGDKQND